MSNSHMSEENPPWVIEFRQSYVDGLSVVKRSLDATPMVVRKYGIGPNEVMAFSSYEKRKQALSVFHFHPDFPFDERKRYMERHNEGYDVAAEVLDSLKAEADQVMLERKHQLKTFGRTIALTLQAMVLYVLTNHPDAR
jgi:hypothetical protein